jgi:sporulation protein YlmC with PRC-barrel domain
MLKKQQKKLAKWTRLKRESQMLSLLVENNNQLSLLQQQKKILVSLQQVRKVTDLVVALELELRLQKWKTKEN